MYGKAYPLLTREMTRERCLVEGAEVPDLPALKNFFRFQASTMSFKVQEKPTDESLNTFAEWFFAGFTRITGTVIGETERSKVYNVS